MECILVNVSLTVLKLFSNNRGFSIYYMNRTKNVLHNQISLVKFKHIFPPKLHYLKRLQTLQTFTRNARNVNCQKANVSNVNSCKEKSEMSTKIFQITTWDDDIDVPVKKFNFKVS